MIAPTSPADILRAARELISTPERWTQGVNARTALGNSVRYDDPAATCFCLYGAICHAAGMSPVGEAWEYLDRLVTLGDPRATVSIFNDYAAHSDVLQLVDEAIALAEQEFSK